MPRLLAIVLLLMGVASAQDVFVGGRVDLEAVVDRGVEARFGRDCGVDATFSKPKLLDAYFDFSLAGQRPRVQEFYLRLPQTRRVVDVTLGRFLLPHADARTTVVDRYVAGAPDLFDTYHGFRRGNVLLDTDVLGLRLSRAWGPLALDLVGAQAADSGNACLAARVVASGARWRGGGSYYLGRDAFGAPLWQAVGHAGWRGAGCELLGQAFWGGDRGDHRGWTWRASFQPRRSHYDFLAAQTAFDPPGGRLLTTTRLGVRRRFAQFYRVELRGELHDARRPAGTEAVVLRLSAVF
jgi:hypothetical protein